MSTSLEAGLEVVLHVDDDGLGLLVWLRDTGAAANVGHDAHLRWVCKSWDGVAVVCVTVPDGQLVVRAVDIPWFGAA